MPSPSKDQYRNKQNPELNAGLGEILTVIHTPVQMVSNTVLMLLVLITAVVYLPDTRYAKPYSQ